MIKAPSAMASPSSTTRGEVTFYTLVFWRANRIRLANDVIFQSPYQ
jgi:hypothetical protein